MKTTTLSNYSDDSRVWIYGFERVLTEEDKKNVETKLTPFIENWNAHGQSLNGGFELMHDRFAFLFVEKNASVSGCSIDSSVKVFKQLREDCDLDALNQGLIFFRKEETIHAVDRAEFQVLIKRSEVTPETIVFDNTIRTLGEYRNGLWETELTNTWHANAFDLG